MGEGGEGGGREEEGEGREAEGEGREVEVEGGGREEEGEEGVLMSLPAAVESWLSCSSLSTVNTRSPCSKPGRTPFQTTLHLALAMSMGLSPSCTCREANMTSCSNCMYTLS